MTNGGCSKQGILLLGTGEMAAEYVKVLFQHGMGAKDINVVGRSRARAEEFAQKFGVLCHWGGTSVLSGIPVCKIAIVAVGPLQLPETALALLERGCQYILLEKPGALYESQLKEVQAAATQQDARIFIAFNRRFYPSVDAVRRMIDEDGGLLSCNFDFTEIEDLVLREKENKNLPEEVLHRWGIVNSIHVIDLFLHLAGIPSSWLHRQGGSLAWHPRSAVFCGSGITNKKVFFSYLSTWNGAGRWGVELTTPCRKLILRPLETLVVQHKGSFQLEAASLPREPAGLKAGFHGQVEALLGCSGGGAGDPRLCPIEEAISHFEVAAKIFGYDS